MIDIVEICSVLDQISLATDSLSLVQQLVLESGGTWIDGATVDLAFLFEVNLRDVRGLGLGATVACDNWIANAKAMIASDETASIHKTRA